MEKKVLYVGRRSEFAMQLIRKNLKEFGCEVIGNCAGAADALALAGELAPDVVMTEHLLAESETDPNIDGISLIRQLMQRYPAVAAVFIASSPYLYETARKAGAKLCITHIPLPSGRDAEKFRAELEQAVNA